jgi:hypothetical protein
MEMVEQIQNIANAFVVHANIQFEISDKARPVFVVWLESTGTLLPQTSPAEMQ